VAGSVDNLQPEVVSKTVLVALKSQRIPQEFASYQWLNIAGQYYSVDIPISQLVALAASPEVDYVEAGHELAPTLSSSLPETRANLIHNPPNNVQGFDGTGVVVGIIDFGFDFTLDDFRNPDGTTRVAFLWDQFLEPQGSETSPKPFPFGVEYDAAMINQALQSPDPFTVVRHKPDIGSHGTHVASTAAGNGRSGDQQFPAGQYIGAAPGATIIFVQPAATDQTTTFTDSALILRGSYGLEIVVQGQSSGDECESQCGLPKTQRR
jgi:subtilisin family serine protease